MHATEIKTVEGKDISAIPPNEPIPVAFNGPQDPENPQGWSAVKRWRGRSIATLIGGNTADDIYSPAHRFDGLLHERFQCFSKAELGFRFEFRLTRFLQSYGATSAGFRKEHTGVSSDLYQLGGAAFLIMLGIGPLVLAPVSETFGRRPMLASLTLL